MENKIEEFKKYVAEQLIDYDNFREASVDGYVNDITAKAVKLFAISDVSGSKSKKSFTETFGANSDDADYSGC